jgi:hypothetical protein
MEERKGGWGGSPTYYVVRVITLLYRCKFEISVYSIWPVIGGSQWNFPNIPVSSTNKTDCHDIAEILLKVALNTIDLNQAFIKQKMF